MLGNLTGKNIIVISVNSGIAEQLALKWISSENNVTGSYRNLNEADQTRLSKIMTLHQLDLSDTKSILDFVDKAPEWDVIVLCSGTMEPIGRFDTIDIESWKQSVSVNFIAQIDLVHRLLPKRRIKDVPTVIFFAGGGTNSAPVNYS
ncbi:MAG: SDR family oxidoreductase, partial [Deltaproteobacteria bacterium]